MTYPDTQPLPDPVTESFDIVFAEHEVSGPNLRFVEVEKTFGHEGLGIGVWWTDEDGYRRLTIRPGDNTGEMLWRLHDRRIPFSLHFDPQTDLYASEWTIEIGAAAYGGMSPAGAVEFALQELERAE